MCEVYLACECEVCECECQMHVGGAGTGLMWEGGLTAVVPPPAGVSMATTASVSPLQPLARPAPAAKRLELHPPHTHPHPSSRNRVLQQLPLEPPVSHFHISPCGVGAKGPECVQEECARRDVSSSMCGVRASACVECGGC